jgi:hypothetical protein
LTARHTVTGEIIGCMDNRGGLKLGGFGP